MNWTPYIALSALLIQSSIQADIFTGKGGLFTDPEKYAENLEKRIAKIHEEEGVLFDAIVTSSGIDGSFLALPAFRNRRVATPTALVHEFGGRFPYSLINSVRVGDFPPKNNTSKSWEDILVINEKIGYLLIPPTQNRRRGSFPLGGSPEQRALAEELASIIEKHRHTVDAFNKALPPRPVGLVIVSDPATFGWDQPPRYLNARFREDRKAFQSLFKSTSGQITDTFRENIVERLTTNGRSPEAYSFIYGGDFRFDADFGFAKHPSSRPYGPGESSLKSIEKLNLQHEDLVVLGPISIGCSEKLDPQGNPSVRVSMNVPRSVFDTSHSIATKLGHIYSTNLTLPLQEWIDGGKDRIIKSVEDCMKQIAEALNQELNAKAVTGTPTNDRDTSNHIDAR